MQEQPTKQTTAQALRANAGNVTASLDILRNVKLRAKRQPNKLKWIACERLTSEQKTALASTFNQYFAGIAEELTIDGSADAKTLVFYMVTSGSPTTEEKTELAEIASQFFTEKLTGAKATRAEATADGIELELVTA